MGLAWHVCLESGDDGACEVYTEIKRVFFSLSMT